MTQEELEKLAAKEYPMPNRENYPTDKEYADAVVRVKDKRVSYIVGFRDGYSHKIFDRR